MPARTYEIQGAGHTGFTVSSMIGALKFWEDLLGSEVLYRRQLTLGPTPNTIGVADARINVALLAIPGGHQVELLEYLSPDGRQTFAPRPCDVGNVHLALNVKNLPAIIEAAEKIGWTSSMREPKKMQRGDGTLWSICYLQGPDGETVEMMEKH